MAKFNRIQPKKKKSLDKGDLSLLELGPRHFPMKDNSKIMNNTADFIFFFSRAKEPISTKVGTKYSTMTEIKDHV